MGSEDESKAGQGWAAREGHRVCAVAAEAQAGADADAERAFSFECVFPEDATNEDVYRVRAQHVAESVVAGFNGTVFAYGQTSSGKTHTHVLSFHSHRVIRSVVRAR